MAKSNSPDGNRELKERLRDLIDDTFGGSVRAAALAIGVPQRTLAWIVAGRTKHPRSDVLQRLAAGFNTTTDWLLRGEGEPPEWAPDGSLHNYAMWHAVLDRLSLPEGVRDQLVDAPRTLEFGIRNELHLKGATERWHDGLAIAKIAAGWAVAFEGLIDEHGIDAVRTALLRHPNPRAFGTLPIKGSPQSKKKR